MGLENLLDGEQGRLGVQRIEHRLDEEQVDAAFKQALERLAVGDDQFVEAHSAKARVVDVRRDRGGFVGWPEHAGDETRPPRVSGLGLQHSFPGEVRCRAIELSGEILHAVVGEGHGGRIERVRLDDIGASLEILQMDLAH